MKKAILALIAAALLVFSMSHGIATAGIQEGPEGFPISGNSGSVTHSPDSSIDSGIIDGPEPTDPY